MKIVVTIEGDDDSDLQFIRDKIDGAVGEIVEDNRSRFDGDVSYSVEYVD